jgi:hypothetical protein
MLQIGANPYYPEFYGEAELDRAMRAELLDEPIFRENRDFGRYLVAPLSDNTYDIAHEHQCDPVDIALFKKGLFLMAKSGDYVGIRKIISQITAHLGKSPSNIMSWQDALGRNFFSILDHNVSEAA